MPSASCHRKSSRLPYTNLGSGAAGTASAGSASAPGWASEDTFENCCPADGHNQASDVVGEEVAEVVLAKSAATFALAGEVRLSCACATLTTTSANRATCSSLFMFSLFER